MRYWIIGTTTTAGVPRYWRGTEQWSASPDDAILIKSDQRAAETARYLAQRPLMYGLLGWWGADCPVVPLLHVLAEAAPARRTL